MKKIIKLTTFIGDNYTATKDIYIFTKSIVHFESCKNGKAQAEVFFITGESILVKESPDEIRKKLS